MKTRTFDLFISSSFLFNIIGKYYYIKWSGLIYNNKEYYGKYDSMLKDIDEKYRTTLINFGKYKIVIFAMAKLMEMKKHNKTK